MLKINVKSYISCYMKFFQNFFTWQKRRKCKQFNTFTHILPMWAHWMRTIHFLSSWSFFAAHQRLVYFHHFLRSAFLAYERYIEVTRRCMYFVSGLFSCVPGMRKMISHSILSSLSLFPPFFSFSLFLSRVQLVFSRLSFVLLCSPFFEICTNRQT